MSIVDTDLSLVKAERNTDLDTNGGKITNLLVGDGLFPGVKGSERAAGLTRYRKAFLRNGNNSSGYANLELLGGKVFFETISPAEDIYYIRIATTEWDEQQDMDPPVANWGAAGYLKNDYSAAAVSIIVVMEESGTSGEGFVTGAEIVLKDADGNYEYCTVDGVTWSTNEATIDITSTPLQNSYTKYRELESAVYQYTADEWATGSSPYIGYTSGGMTVDAHIGKIMMIISGTGSGQMRRVIDNTAGRLYVEYDWTTTPSTDSVFVVINVIVSHVVELGNVLAKYNNFVVTHLATGDGDYDPSGGNLTMLIAGCVEDTWTLTYTLATDTFQVVGARYGNLGDFDASSDIKPPNGSSYYFDMLNAGFDAGSWEDGDYITFETQAAGRAFWVKQKVPIGANPHLANEVDLGIGGDSV